MNKWFSVIPVLCVLAQATFSQPLPNESWRTLAGDELSPRTVITKGPTLVTFWALWCAPCKLEMRALKVVHSDFADRGFSVIAVNEDSPRSLAKVRAYVAANQLPFHVVPDPNAQILERMNVSVLPHSILYDTNGDIAYTSVGYKPGDEQRLKDAIRRVLELR